MATITVFRHRDLATLTITIDEVMLHSESRPSILDEQNVVLGANSLRLLKHAAMLASPLLLYHDVVQSCMIPFQVFMIVILNVGVRVCLENPKAACIFMSEC